MSLEVELLTCLSFAEWQEVDTWFPNKIEKQALVSEGQLLMLLGWGRRCYGKVLEDLRVWRCRQVLNVWKIEEKETTCSATANFYGVLKIHKDLVSLKWENIWPPPPSSPHPHPCKVQFIKPGIEAIFWNQCTVTDWLFNCELVISQIFLPSLNSKIYLLCSDI